MEIPSAVKKRLTDAHQLHLIQYWPELTDEQQQILLHDINEIDFDRVRKAYERVKHELGVGVNGMTNGGENHIESEQDNQENIDDLMEPVPDDIAGSVNEASQEQLDNYRRKGLQAVSEGAVCALLLAGGQGTRLGVNYPKGMFNVGLPSKKCLYQIQAERIRRLEQLANEYNNSKGATIPWFIMTSEHTQEQTEKYFRSNQYFGLNPANVIFFEQYTLPALAFDGKILMEEKYKLTKSADGNGGLYRALKSRNILTEMSRRQIKYIHVYGVDNILVRLADPVFIGFCIEKNADCAAKVVKKAVPNEAVGVICKVRDRYQVVEYSEISEKTAQKKKSETSDDLLFNAGNICNHFFTLNFLQDVCQDHDDELRYHVAKKKIPSIDSHGERVEKPADVNGIKMEKFVFDVFPFAKTFAIWDVRREDEFSPLKNATGHKDTDQTCRRDLMNQHIRYLRQAGAILPETNELICEISPLVSYSGENLQFLQGQTLTSPLRIELNSTTGQPELSQSPRNSVQINASI